MQHHRPGKRSKVQGLVVWDPIGIQPTTKPTNKTPPKKLTWLAETSPFFSRRYIFKWLFFYCHVRFRFRGTPWKINMEPSNHPLRKENDLFTKPPGNYGTQPFIFRGVWMFPKIVGFPPKSSILVGFSIINHPFWSTLLRNPNPQHPKPSSSGWCVAWQHLAQRLQVHRGHLNKGWGCAGYEDWPGSGGRIS